MTGSAQGFWFSGGINGVDSLYDAVYPDVDQVSEVFAFRRPIGDVNGDGWEDFGAGNPAFSITDGGASCMTCSVARSPRAGSSRSVGRPSGNRGRSGRAPISYRYTMPTVCR